MDLPLWILVAEDPAEVSTEFRGKIMANGLRRTCARRTSPAALNTPHRGVRRAHGVVYGRARSSVLVSVRARECARVRGEGVGQVWVGVWKERKGARAPADGVTRDRMGVT